MAEETAVPQDHVEVPVGQDEGPDDFSGTLIDVEDDSPVKLPGEETSESEDEKSSEPPKKQEAKAPALKPGEKPPEEEPEYEIKVSGEAKKVKLNDLIRMAQKGEAADQRFQQAAAARQEIEQFLNQVSQNPWSVFEALGQDPRRAAEKFVWEQMVEAQMSPQQRQLYLDKKRLTEMEAREAQRAQQAQLAEQQRAQDAIIEQYEPALQEAIAKHGVPDTDYAAVRLVEAMLTDLAYGIEPDAKSLADRVKADLQKEISGTLGGLDPETLAALLGEDATQKVAQARAKKLPAKPKAPTKQPQALERPQARAKSHYTTEDDLSAALDAFVKRGS